MEEREFWLRCQRSFKQVFVVKVSWGDLMVGFHQERKSVVSAQDFAVAGGFYIAFPGSHRFDRIH